MTQGPPCERGSSSLARRPLCRSLALGEARSQCRCENPSPQPPPRDGEGEQAKQYLFFSPSPCRGGGWGEGFSHGRSAAPEFRLSAIRCLQNERVADNRRLHPVRQVSPSVAAQVNASPCPPSKWKGADRVPEVPPDAHDAVLGKFTAEAWRVLGLPAADEGALGESRGTGCLPHRQATDQCQLCHTHEIPSECPARGLASLRALTRKRELGSRRLSRFGGGDDRLRRSLSGA